MILQMERFVAWTSFSSGMERQASHSGIGPSPGRLQSGAGSCHTSNNLNLALVWSYPHVPTALQSSLWQEGAVPVGDKFFGAGWKRWMGDIKARKTMIFNVFVKWVMSFVKELVLWKRVSTITWMQTRSSVIVFRCALMWPLSLSWTLRAPRVLMKALRSPLNVRRFSCFAWVLSFNIGPGFPPGVSFFENEGVLLI